MDGFFWTHLVNVTSNTLLAHLIEEAPGAADLVGALALETGDSVRGGLATFIPAAALDGAGNVALVPAADLLRGLDNTLFEAGIDGARA